MVEAQTTTWDQERTLARHHSPAPGYVNSGMSIFSRAADFTQILASGQGARARRPLLGSAPLAGDLDPRQAQDRLRRLH